MNTKSEPKELKEILDFLQTVYRLRLNPDLMPSILKEPFYKAVKRFSGADELKKINKSKMGICEEAADLTYQTLKIICLTEGILAEESIRALDKYLEKNNYYDKDKRLIGLDYQKLDELAGKLVSENLILKLRSLLPDMMFSPNKDGGYSILKDFLAGQFVAYLSRVWTGRHRDNAQALIHLRDEKIPEETRELIEALFKSSENLTGRNLLDDLEINIKLSRELLDVIEVIRRINKTNNLLFHLAYILKTKMEKPITIEDALHLMFLKMKGRQEMTFSGIDEQTMRQTCKPVEYLIEADMFF